MTLAIFSPLRSPVNPLRRLRSKEQAMILSLQELPPLEQRAERIHSLVTTAEVIERRAKGLNGLAEELPRRAAQLRRLATKIAAGRL